MAHLKNITAELLWLGGAALFAFFFLKTFLVIEIVALTITITLMQVERAFR